MLLASQEWREKVHSEDTRGKIVRGEGGFYILQVRPVTIASAAATGENPQKSGIRVVEEDGTLNGYMVLKLDLR